MIPIIHRKYGNDAGMIGGRGTGRARAWTTRTLRGIDLGAGPKRDDFTLESGMRSKSRFSRISQNKRSVVTHASSVAPSLSSLSANETEASPNSAEAKPIFPVSEAAMGEGVACTEEDPRELPDRHAMLEQQLCRLPQPADPRVTKRIVEHLPTGARSGHPLQQRLETRVAAKDATAPVARRKRPAPPSRSPTATRPVRLGSRLRRRDVQQGRALTTPP